ncbi:MAG TPA: protein kinase [Pyrinomonadaceae bacterium]|nr:protein kinase [Pyrinomonadaceae bacterium]
MKKPERWDQISQIFESALALKPEERLAYLKAQCEGDDSLRQEVELLIESHEKADEQGFIDLPAAQRAAPLLVQDEEDQEQVKNRLEAGQKVSHYLITKKLGAGGMGEVYLAKDTTLDRTVALKILPADVASDKRRMQRFKQEAKIASTLNQPNIVTIFEFGESGSLHFIATEYIDGETLRQHLRINKIKLSEVLDISIQLVAALDAAHEANIIHRDIKPENIMIRRRDHLVKVLDFGLAKLTERPSAESLGASVTEAPTQAFLKTAPGSVMGTIAYMSPEQAQGLTLDQRTDIWSTGVVIYEMVAGRAPFKGVTASHTVVEILEREPPALNQAIQVPVPLELERIISKALAKNPDERYQTTKDMLIDLRNLRKRLELDAELDRSAAPLRGSTPRITSESPRAPSTSASASGSTSSERTSSERWKLALGVLFAVVALVGGLMGVNAWRASRSPRVVTAPVPVAERSLNYWIMVQKYRDGRPYQEPFRLAHEIVFEKDYRVRLNVSSPDDGYFYLLNEGPQAGNQFEQYIILFPSPTANEGSARLVGNQEIQIPEESWFQFDDEAGTEKLWLVWSEGPVAALEAVKRFANPEDKGLITDPVRSQALKGFLDRYSSPGPSVEKSDEKRLSVVKSQERVLVHHLRLEHY